ncbi:hypothetical protein [Romboutsia sp.]|uniref:hypothetical protein n=1 Tax=Romboutsia sp. TaxID=1965302 RepID=UPI003F2D027B
MNKRNKIFLILIIVCMGVSILLKNEMISSIFYVGSFTFIVSMKLVDFIIKNRITTQIKKTNTEYIIVKENNKWMLLIAPMIIYSMVRGIKIRVEMYKVESSNIDMMGFINSLDSYEKGLILVCILLIVLTVLSIVEVIFSTSYLTNNKVIFFDGQVFDIDKIESIKYEDSMIFKNKKKIALGKGFVDRKIIINIEDFNKVKNILAETK